MSDFKSISLSTIIKQSEKILVQNIDEDTVMANIDSGFYFGVNQTSKRIWELVSLPTSLSDICTQLRDEYDVDQTTCEAEVIGFVADMAREGLVVIV